LFARGLWAEGGQQVYLDSREIGLVSPGLVILTEPGSDGFFCSPDSRHLACVAQRGGQQFVAVDGVAGKPYDWIGGKPLFSPDSQRLAYVAATVRQGVLSWHVVVDDVEGKGYRGIAWHHPLLDDRLYPFSPDSKRIAYVATPLVDPGITPDTGSGFVISPDGYVVTCAHVVAGAGVIQVAIGGKTYAAAVVTTESAADLALLKIEAAQLPTLVLGDSEQIETGADINVVGYPLATALTRSVTIKRGVLSGRTRDRLLQTDAGINPGNSGGPLINERGEVVGIVNARLVGPGVGKVGFAIPTATLQSILRKHHIVIVSTAAPAKANATDLRTTVEPAMALISVVSANAFVMNMGSLKARPFVVVDGAEGKEYGDVLARGYINGGVFGDSLTWSRDGKRFGYAAWRQGRARLVVNGAEEPFTVGGELGHPRPYFSADSAHMAYSAWERSCFAVVDGQRQPGHYDEIGTFVPGVGGKLPTHVAFVFSPDSKRLAYIARRGKRRLVVLDRREGKEYDEIPPLVFSADSKRLAYIGTSAVDGGKTSERKLVVHESDGNVRETPLRGAPSPPLFSADSRRLALTVRYVRPPEPGQQSPDFLRQCCQVMVDGQTGKEYRLGPVAQGEFGALLFSPDSKHVAYSARAREEKPLGNDACFVVQDGVEGKHYTATDSLVYSPDSAHLGYVATTTPVHMGYHQVAVLDGKEGKVYERIDGLVFSPDSRHLMYRAFERCNEPLRWRIVVDGVEGKVYESRWLAMRWQQAPTFDSADSFHYLAGRFRVETRLSVR
jgi:S1-C subfamily serine protease